MDANDSTERFTRQQLLDPGALGRLAADVGAASLGVLLAAFESELLRRRGALQGAIEAKDVPAIAATTHAIKGSALTFGATALGDAASQANVLARAGEADAVAAAEQVLALNGPTLAETSRQTMERSA